MFSVPLNLFNAYYDCSEFSVLYIRMVCHHPKLYYHFSQEYQEKVLIRV